MWAMANADIDCKSYVLIVNKVAVLDGWSAPSNCLVFTWEMFSIRLSAAIWNRIIVLILCFSFIPCQTAQQYAKEFKNLTGINARHESSFAYDAAWAIALVLNTSAQRLAGTFPEVYKEYALMRCTRSFALAAVLHLQQPRF